MFSLVCRTLDSLGKVPVGSGETDLSDFIDGGDASPWARKELSRLVAAGIVSGSGGRLDPEGRGTRAQMAQLHYQLLLRGNKPNKGPGLHF